jgi:hypothetical protein
VSSGTLSTVEFLYDLGATLTVNVAATPAGAPSAQWDDAYGVIAGHNGISTGFRSFPDPAASSAVQTHTLRGLFPFHEDAYKIYSGTCTDADPIAGTRPDNYFDLLDIPENGPVDATPELEPGEARTITIYEQAINLNATWSGTAITHGSPTSSNQAYAYAYPKAGACPTPTRIPLGTVVAGKAQRPGVPFGTYDICVERWRDSSNGWYTSNKITNISVNASPGTPVRNVPLTTSSTRGRCSAT